MSGYNVTLPNYSVGEDCYNEIPNTTKKHGTKAVVIGGKTAMEKAKKAILDGVAGTSLEILDFLWYGGDSNMENVEMLKDNPIVKSADMLFGVGGGRACDTVKTLAHIMDKPVFTFPTLASNCASCTSLCVIYNKDGSFKEYYYLDAPPCHTFINTKIIAESPYDMFWAGIGDAISKEYEVAFACKEKNLYHVPLLGLGVAKICTDPLVKLGKKALEDCKNNIASFELEQVALDIIMLTGIVSNCETHINQPNDKYYYNSSLAHCVYYGSSLIAECEKKHLHGEIVAFGVLCLLTYDNQFDVREELMNFYKEVGLPVTMDQIGLTKEDLPIVAKKASTVIEWEYVPGTPTEEKFIQSIIDADAAGKNFLTK